MSYEKEEDERSEINWDRLGGEGVQSTSNMKFLLNEGVQTVKKRLKKPYL